MEIFEEFRVPLPVDEAWRLLLDIERIAPCMPGAQLQEIEGDEYRGVVKVKVGPITAQYKGTAKLESTDDSAHTAVIVASGRDTRGQGNASATVKLSLGPDGDRTLVSVETDLSITGKVAQFGRGVLNDVSGKLLAQFVENLEREVLSAESASAEIRPEPSPEPPDVPDPQLVPAVGVTGASRATANGSAPGEVREIRRIDGPDAAPVDLLAVSGESVGKRLLPIGGLLLLLLVLLGIRRKRRRTS
jgi:carbon monoxide dehydrogenase subunit G